MRGSGTGAAGTEPFEAPGFLARVVGEAPGVTTPEEFPLASHAICFEIGLRSNIGRRGGMARRVRVEATMIAGKGPLGIRIQRSHLRGVV